VTPERPFRVLKLPVHGPLERGIDDALDPDKGPDSADGDVPLLGHEIDPAATEDGLPRELAGFCRGVVPPGCPPDEPARWLQQTAARGRSSPARRRGAVLRLLGEENGAPSDQLCRRLRMALSLVESEEMALLQLGKAAARWEKRLLACVPEAPLPFFAVCCDDDQS